MLACLRSLAADVQRSKNEFSACHMENKIEQTPLFRCLDETTNNLSHFIFQLVGMYLFYFQYTMCKIQNKFYKKKK